VDHVRQIAQAVLYEGYLLWPYRRSALKNRQRWTFGCLYPEAYAAAHQGDPSVTQTQCLLETAPVGGPAGGVPGSLDVRVRFLQAVTRDVARAAGDEPSPVPELTVEGRRHLPGEEAVEREAAACGLALSRLLRGHRADVTIPAGRETEWLCDATGRRVGAVVRSWQELRVRLFARAEPVGPGVLRVTTRVTNTSAWHGEPRAETLHRTLASAHTVLHARGGRFVSLMDPPDRLRAAAAACRNTGAWPVLIGEEGERHTMLSAPIVLYDHPKVAPESPGDLFDATEIDQLLTLSVLALADDERQEIRDGDPRAREILDRCASLTQEQLMRLHGTLRDVRRVPGGEAPA
jgi:hypothetical protein